jgi:hypothetical protein
MKLPRKWMWIPAPALAALVWSGVAQGQPTAPPPPPPLDPWYEALDFRLFADAYASMNHNLPRRQADANGPRDPDTVGVRAYDNDAGFSLSWVGFDVSHAPEPVGGTISLRLGPTAETYSQSCLSSTTQCDGDVPGLGFVKQAYASWRPGGTDGDFTFDFGKFDTIFGAEVAESQDNLNYTRGALYWLGQPLFHTGLRAGWNIIPEWQLTVLAVNGWNNTIDNNLGKTVGIQSAFHPLSTMSLYVGWLAGPEQDDTATVVCDADTAYSAATGDCFPDPGRPAGSYTVEQGRANLPEAWRELVDLVVTWVPHERLRLVLNADYGRHGLRQHGAGPTDVSVTNQQYYGVMLAGRYQLSEAFAVAARGEYFGDPDGMQTNIEGLELATGTLTVEAMPSDFLQLRLEERADFALEAENGTRIFQRSARRGASEMFTTTLGVVVTTN